jgi:iron complex outermembrane receptor protein
MFKKNLILCGAGIALAAAWTGGAAAAETDTAARSATQVQELIVTARKREENIQRVPIAVTAQTGLQLLQQHIQTFTDLAQIVPSMLVNNGFSQSTGAGFTIRGISSGDDSGTLTFAPPVGLYEDTANIPHPVGTNLSFVDIARVEVLKGPQGTLYGRNTTGGAINIITQGADYNGIHGYITGEAGNYDDAKVTGAVNIPIIPDVLAIRLAGQYWYREGYMTDVTNGERLGGTHDDGLIRLSVRFDPTSRITSTTKFEYVDSHQHEVADQLAFIGGDGGSTAALEAGLESGCGSFANFPALVSCGTSALNAQIPKSPLVTYAGLLQHVDTTLWHFVEDATFTITPDVSLRSITGGHHVKSYQIDDVDSTTFQLVECCAGQVDAVGAAHPWPLGKLPDQEYTSWTQEFDLSGRALDKRLNWLVGVFGSTDRGNAAEPDAAVPLLTPTAITGSIVPLIHQSSWGVYTQDDFRFNDIVSVTVGTRYSSQSANSTTAQVFWNSQNGTFGCNGLPTPNNSPYDCEVVQHEKSSGWSYLASLNIQFTPDELLYLKTSRGFKGGTLQQRAPDQPSAKPEYATDYEIGLKSALFDKRLILNIDAYDTEYQNKVEAVSIINAAGTLETIFENAASARIKGFEADFNARPAAGLSIYGTLSYLDARFTKYPNATNPYLSGDPIACVPAAICVNAAGLQFRNPPWQYSVGGRYEHDVASWAELSGELDWHWVSAIPQNALTADPVVPAALTNEFHSAQGSLNGRLQLSVPSQHLSVALFATNLTNNVYRSEGLDLAAPLGFITALVSEPRTFGIEIHMSFGPGE